MYSPTKKRGRGEKLRATDLSLEFREGLTVGVKAMEDAPTPKFLGKMMLAQAWHF